MTDFVVSNQCAYPLSSSVTYSNLSKSYLHALSAYSSITKPVSFQQASKYLAKVHAIKLEVTALESNHM